MADPVRKSGAGQIPLSVVKDDPSRFVRVAEYQLIAITPHCEPAGVLIGVHLEDVAAD